MSDDICGSTDTTDGSPCQRSAGWGRDEDDGPCVDHETDEVRPRKLTKELQERIASDLEAGIPVKHAAPANGITENTYYRWVRLGEEADEGVLSQFSQRVTRACEHGKGSILRDAVTIAREERDPRALLKAYAQIEGGSAAGDEDLAGLNLVVPEIAVRDDDE